MAASTQWTDRVWLAWFALQILVILLVDAVPFYPESLYRPPGAPFHALQRIRDWYVAAYNDPIVQWEPAAGDPSRAWVLLFGRVELLFQLPTAVYAVYRLGGFGASGVSGADELLFLVYALETALTTAVCLNDVLWWDEGVFAPEVKRVFLFQIYGPWFAIPALMFVNMYRRVLGRMSQAAQTDRIRKLQ